MLSLKKFISPILQAQSTIRSNLTPNNFNGIGAVCYVASTSATKATQKLNLPEPPKKPLAPFIKYHLSVRPEILKENPNLKPTEITKIAGKKWSTINDEEKARMSQNYTKEIREWNYVYQKYEDNLTTEQKAMIQNLRNELLFKRAERKKRADKKLHGKPKQTPNPFSLFVESKGGKGEKVTKGGKNYIMEAAEEWKKMPAEDKIKFEEQSRALREGYVKELLAWEAKMIREGHPDLVRLSSRSEINTPKRNRTEPKDGSEQEKSKRGKPKKTEKANKE